MTQCKNCDKEVDSTASICTVCLYPINGSDQEKASFIAKQVMQKSDVEYSFKSLENSRNVLFGLAGFYLIVPNLGLIGGGLWFQIAFNVIIALTFGGFALIVFKKPKLALGLPLAMILCYYVLLMFIDPMLVMQGYIWKVAVLVGLSYGLVNAYKSDKILKENPYLASVLGYSRMSDKK